MSSFRGLIVGGIASVLTATGLLPGVAGISTALPPNLGYAICADFDQHGPTPEEMLTLELDLAERGMSHYDAFTAPRDAVAEYCPQYTEAIAYAEQLARERIPSYPPESEPRFGGTPEISGGGHKPGVKG